MSPTPATEETSPQTTTRFFVLATIGYMSALDVSGRTYAPTREPGTRTSAVSVSTVWRVTLSYATPVQVPVDRANDSSR